MGLKALLAIHEPLKSEDLHFYSGLGNSLRLILEVVPLSHYVYVSLWSSLFMCPLR